MTDKELISIVDAKAKKLWSEINTGHEYSIIDSYNQFYGICMEIAETIVGKEEPVGKVWHYQKEEPIDNIVDKSRPIVVIYGYNSLNAAGKFRCYEDNSKAIWLSNAYEKWSFVEDLINLSHSVVKTRDKEEPVSEDLEEELARWMKEHFDKDMSRYSGCYLTNDSLIELANHFAKWKKEQMMAKAVEVTVHIDAGNYPYIPQIELYDYDKDEPLAKEGDKYKVVLIKEE